MSKPLVSVCVPTYNRAGLLRESLKTVCQQDYAPLEILVSDNGSTDETEQVCREFMRADSRIRYVRHPQSIGLYGNHNFCIEESRGELLCLYHDDDQYSPGVVSESAAFLDRHPEVGVVCSDWELINDADEVVGLREFPVGPVIEGFEYIERTIRSGRSSICCPGAMIRRSALGSIRFDVTGPIGFGDFVVWFQVAERACVGHIGKRLWRYRQHARSLSRRTIESLTRDFRENLNRFCDDHLARWPTHGRLVRRWRQLAERYVFWALVYELCLHARHAYPSPTRSLSRTVFELADYRLSPEEVGRVLESLRRLRRGALQRATLFAIERLLDADLRAPLAWATSHTQLARTLLRLR